MTSAAHEWLWESLHDLFDTDDGSSPEIHVGYPRRGGVPAGFGYLTSLADPLSGDATYWSVVDQRDEPIENPGHVAELVVGGQSDPFHVSLRGVRFEHGPELPDLGCFVFPDQLALDYRPGPSWGACELSSLFSVLKALVELSEGASLSAGAMGVADADRFTLAWNRFLGLGRGRD